MYGCKGAQRHAEGYASLVRQPFSGRRKEDALRACATQCVHLVLPQHLLVPRKHPFLPVSHTLCVDLGQLPTQYFTTADIA